jgi:hypothetical protein
MEEGRMSLSGTRGLIRISQNRQCELAAAMVVDRVQEPDFYRRVTGRAYPGEYGERAAARRRGAKFEENLHANDAALLRNQLGPLFGWDPVVMVVRNFALEVPGPPDTMRAVRLHRTRNVLRDLSAGKPVPHLLIQPQFQLPTGPGPHDFEYVSPDHAVLDPALGIYVPGEEKSFIVRNNVADGADLDLTRRQAGCEILALRAEADRVGLADRVLNRAVFVFATPYGLSPARPFLEVLDAEVHEIQRAIRVLAAVRTQLAALRAPVAAPLEMLVTDLETNYQESCQRICLMANECKSHFAGKARLLGDLAADLFGPEADLARIAALAAGAPPATPQEAAIAPRLVEAARRCA